MVFIRLFSLFFTYQSVHVCYSCTFRSQSAVRVRSTTSCVNVGNTWTVTDLTSARSTSSYSVRTSAIGLWSSGNIRLNLEVTRGHRKVTTRSFRYNLEVTIRSLQGHCKVTTRSPQGHLKVISRLFTPHNPRAAVVPSRVMLISSLSPYPSPTSLYSPI